MRVVSTTDRTVETKDCKVFNNISIVEKFGIYAVIVVEKITGIIETEAVRVLLNTTDIAQAFNCYSEHGGSNLVKEKD
jgi:hypothetical protein